VIPDKQAIYNEKRKVNVLNKQELIFAERKKFISDTKKLQLGRK
jgi:hypothetical protein